MKTSIATVSISGDLKEKLEGTSNNSDFVIGLTIATARRPFSLLS